MKSVGLEESKGIRKVPRMGEGVIRGVSPEKAWVQ